VEDGDDGEEQGAHGASFFSLFVAASPCRRALFSLKLYIEKVFLSMIYPQNKKNLDCSRLFQYYFRYLVRIRVHHIDLCMFQHKSLQSLMSHIRRRKEYIPSSEKVLMYDPPASIVPLPQRKLSAVIECFSVSLFVNRTPCPTSIPAQST